MTTSLPCLKQARFAGSYKTFLSFEKSDGLRPRLTLGKTKLLFSIILVLLGYNLSFSQPGTLDNTFDLGSGANFRVQSSSIQADGKIIIGGWFSSYNGTARGKVARLNTDGSLDYSFDPGPTAFGNINDTAIQSDGKIIIGGIFTVARLNTDGSLDNSFNPGTGPNQSIFTVAVQTDGKILIGGNFSAVNGVQRQRLARLNANGSVDMSFNPAAFSGSVETISIQSDGKIIIGGQFNSYNNTGQNNIVRLNADGSLDTSFNQAASGANGPVFSSFIQSDGKIIIGGVFSSYSGTTKYRLARLNVDGSIDYFFALGAGASPGGVLAISGQSDGKIIIGGEFTSFNGTARGRIARLNVDGSLDTSFDPGTGVEPGPNNKVSTISIQSDGKIIIGGEFTSYNGTSCNRIARVNSTTTLGTSELANGNERIVISPNPFSNSTTLYLKRYLNNASLTIYNLSGQSVKQLKNLSGRTVTLDRDNLPAGLYFVQMSQDNQTILTDKVLIKD